MNDQMQGILLSKPMFTNKSFPFPFILFSKQTKNVFFFVSKIMLIFSDRHFHCHTYIYVNITENVSNILSPFKLNLTHGNSDLFTGVKALF